MSDAFGQMVADYFQTDKGYEIIEREDGYITANPIHYFKPFEEWPLRHQTAMDFVKDRVLDIGTGAGRVPLYLQACGLEVVAIDISPLTIDVCQKRGVYDARVISITQVSNKLGCFDTMVMLGNNFGLFSNPKRAKWLLKRFHKITTDDGLIVAETRNPYATDNPIHFQYHDYNRQRGRLGGQARIRVRFRQYKGDWMDYLMVSQGEMRQILDGTGWQIRQIIDDADTPNYIAIIGKISQHQ